MTDRLKAASHGYSHSSGYATGMVPVRRAPDLLFALQREAVYLLIVLMIIGYPMVASLVSLAGVDSTVITIPYRVGVFALAFLILFSTAIRKLHGSLDFWLLAYLLLYLARISHDWIYVDLPGAFETWRFYVVVLLVPTLVLGLTVDLRIEHTALVKRLAAIGAAFCVLFFIARVFGLSAATTVDTHGGRYEVRESLEALNAISLGNVFVSIFLACLIGFFMLRAVRWKIFSVGTGAVALYGLLLAASRGPMMALILAVAWFALMRLSRTLFLIPVLLLGSVFLSFDSLAMRRLMEVLNFDVNTMAYTMWLRLQVQQSALADLWENPVFGKHFLDPAWGEGHYPHNIVIETGMAMGLLGLLALVFLHLRLAGAVLRHTNACYPLIALLLVQYFVIAQTSGAIWGADRYLPLVALALSLAASAGRPVPPGSKPPRHSG